MRLEGRVTLVTGANRNIGRAIALELAGRARAFVSGQMIGVNGAAST